MKKNSDQTSEIRISRDFIVRLKLDPQPAYRIAQKAGVNPTTLSKLVNGIEAVRPNDARILRVSEVLGLSAEEAFESEMDKRNKASNGFLEHENSH